eukprot:7377992-Prymnesium_polylepis.1
MDQTWSRTLYSIVVIAIYLRVLQFLRYFQSVGVLTICLGSMMTDVGLFINHHPPSPTHPRLCCGQCQPAAA